jgi:arginyl-tRNA synthetase
MRDFAGELASLLTKHLALDESQARELLSTPPDPALGDIALPCFRLAKELKRAPVEIANDLAGKLRGEACPEWLVIVRADGPFVNFTIDPATRAAGVIATVREGGDAFGGGQDGAGKTVVIDYSSPNIAKPFGIGHLRSTVIGAATYRLHKALGWNCVGINHLGDWGTQFGKLITAFLRWGEGDPKDLSIEDLYRLYVQFHREAEDNPELEDEGRAWHKRLEDSDPEARALWQSFRDASLAEFQRIYQQLSVHFDSWSGESFYQDKVDDAVKLPVEKGIAKWDDGALIVDLRDDNLGVALLQKSDGATLYATRDLAAALYRAESYHFDRLLYVVGSEQSQYFQQLFRVFELLGLPWARRCEHVAFGRILGMSTRKGTVIFLNDVLDEAAKKAEQVIAERNPELENREETARLVGVGAIVFADLARRRIRDYEFDWDEILNFDGETGPYAQYTHARLCSILRKADRPVPETFDAAELATQEEQACVRVLERYPAVVRRAAEECEPSYVTTYIIELATVANSFYQKHHVNDDAAPARTDARLALVEAVRQTLANGLRILGIHPLERM